MKKVHLGILMLILGILLIGCQTSARMPSSEAASGNWYRGNTHTHSNKSIGNAPPEAVAAVYLERGYNFLCMTDWNAITEPGSANLPSSVRKDFILIPSEEIYSGNTHANAVNISTAVSPIFGADSITAKFQQYERDTTQAGGVLIIDHPNYNWAVNAADIRPLRNVFLFELYNGYIGNEGDADHLSTEAMWDQLLTDGMRIFGVAADDAAYYTAFDRWNRNPERGWVMVRAKELTPQAIADAMKEGQFYASTGVFLGVLEVTSVRIRVTIDKRKTEDELAKGFVVGRPAPAGSRLGERIDFLGRGGKLLSSVRGLDASCKLDPEASAGYVRARAVVTRDVNGRLVDFYAWAQPVFLPAQPQ